MSRTQNGIMFLALVVWLSCHGIAEGISVNVDPNKPALGNSMTLTCKRSISSTSSISWGVDSVVLTTCDGTKNDVCIPSPTGYTYSTDVSANEFNLTLATTAITDCKNYTCTDTDTNSDTISKNIQLADFSKNDITQTEPGANTDGSISITTGCVLSPDDLTITWTKIVNGNSVALSADDPSPVTTTNRSTCSRTCHTDEDKKATIGFTHTEYTETDSETFQYMVTVSHSSYPDNADIYTWTSANYTQKKEPPASITIPTTASSTTTTTPPSSSTQRPNTLSIPVIIVLCVVSVLVLLAIPIIIYVYLRYKRNQSKSKKKENPQSYKQDHSSKENKRQFSDIGSSDMKEHQRVTNPSTNRSNAYQGDITQTEQL